MSTADLSEILTGLLPAILVAVIAFYFFQSQSKNDEMRRQYSLRRENQKTALPIRLQAYERMALFLERISLGKLVFRIPPGNQNKKEYTAALIQTIEKEFEHNLAQQIYITPACWDYIRTAKNATIGIIRKVQSNKEINDGVALRDAILNNMVDNNPPSDAALAYIKNEVKAFL